MLPVSLCERNLARLNPANIVRTFEAEVLKIFKIIQPQIKKLYRRSYKVSVPAPLLQSGSDTLEFPWLGRSYNYNTVNTVYAELVTHASRLWKRSGGARQEVKSRNASSRLRSSPYWINGCLLLDMKYVQRKFNWTSKKKLHSQKQRNSRRRSLDPLETVTRKWIKTSLTKVLEKVIPLAPVSLGSCCMNRVRKLLAPHSHSFWKNYSYTIKVIQFCSTD